MPVEAVKITPVQEIKTETEIKKVEPKTEPYPNDSVELSSKKNKTAKTILGIGAGIATAGATFCLAVILMARHHGNKIAKLYKEKLVLSNLPEKLDFKEAKTVEEGIKFAKEVLGIKEVDKDFTLEAINTANKGLVGVSNANKGKLFIPTRLGFEVPKNTDDNYLAYVVQDIYSKNFGNLVINKNYFDKQVLDKEIRKLLFNENGKPFYTINQKTDDIASTLVIGSVRPIPKKEIANLIEKFYNNCNDLSISEKQKLFYSLEYAFDSALSNHRNPLILLEKISKQKAEFLKNNNLEINFDEVKKLTTEKQVEYLKNLTEKLEQNEQYLISRFDASLPETTIYHEMGHLQDFAKNLKELDVKQWGFSFREAWRNAKHKQETGEDISRIGVKEVDNRWGSTWKEAYEKLLIKDPEKFRKQYPDLYEFVTNQEIQQTAGKVSSYAQSGIGEFIAEVYTKLILREKIPEDVSALYKRYKGPELPKT